MARNMSLAEAAQSYAAKGWHVFPLQPRGKKPLVAEIRSWADEATTDPETVSAWWARYPNANIGLRCGSFGPGVAIDIDEPEALERLPQKLAPTLCSRTAHGWHLFYDADGFSNAEGNLPKGINVRGDRGYVVAPPSIHPDGGVYQWQGAAEKAAPMPDWLRNLIQPPPPPPRPVPAFQTPAQRDRRIQAYVDAAVSAVVADVARNEKGHNNNKLTACAYSLGRLVGAGYLSAIEAERVAMDAAQACGGWPPRKALDVINRAIDRGRMDPHVLDTDAGDMSPSGSWVEVAPAESDSASLSSGTSLNASQPADSAGAYFPVNALPPWLRDWVNEISEATQTPPGLPAWMALTAWATACQARVTLDVRPGWSEALNLWAIVCMPPSARKSPVFSAAMRPILQFEAEIAEAGAVERALAGEVWEVEKTRVADLKRKLAKCGDRHEQADLMDRLRDQIEAAQRAEPSALKQLVVQDVTPEALVRVMHANGGTVSVLSDEGGIFTAVAGRYSGEINADALLAGWSGGMVRQARISREPLIIERAILTLGLAVQLQPILEGMAKRGLSGRGLFARPFWCVPESKLGERRPGLATQPASPLTLQRYGDRIAEMLESTPGRTISLEPPATAALIEACTGWERRIGPGGDLEVAGQWVGKLESNTLRLAALLQLAADPLSTVVTLQAMLNAIAISDYAIPHALQLFSTPHDAQAHEYRVIILDAMQRGVAVDEGGSFHRRALWNALRRKFRQDISAFDVAIGDLVNSGEIYQASMRPVIYRLVAEAL